MSGEPDLFDAAVEDLASGPLAARMRPRTLDEVVGQDHLLGEGAPLRRLVETPVGEGVASDRATCPSSCGARPVRGRRHSPIW